MIWNILTYTNPETDIEVMGRYKYHTVPGIDAYPIQFQQLILTSYRSIYRY